MHLPQESASVSRRSFMRMAGIIAAVPALSESYFAHAALQSAQQPAKAAPKPMSQQQAMKQMMMSIPKDAVLINANENPLGPCEAARSAIAVRREGDIQQASIWAEIQTTALRHRSC